MNFAIVIQSLLLLCHYTSVLGSSSLSCDTRDSGRFRFCLDLCTPCSGSVMELSSLPAVNQSLRNIMGNLRNHLWELHDAILSAHQEYENTVFQGDTVMIAQSANAAEELITSTNVRGRCEMHESHSRLGFLLTEVSLQMKPLHTGYAKQKFLSVTWSDSLIQNALCNLKMLASSIPGNTSSVPCSYSVRLRRLRTGQRRLFAMWMLRRINVSVNLVEEIESEYRRIRNQMDSYI